MKIFNSISEFQCTKKTVLTLGTFDGVHLGHQKILNKLIQNTVDQKTESVVLTFFPHPRMVLQGQSEVKLLNTLNEKIELLRNLGIQNLVIQTFNKEFSDLTASEFVENILVKKFNIQKIIIGHDHRFGKNRSANIDDLLLFGTAFNFEVAQISAQEIEEVAVSSTKIRKELLDGNVALANDYLGYDYFLTGVVVKGKELGRTIGFPTANLSINENDKLLPKNGVYIVKSIINQKTVFGMMNIGFNPTVLNEKIAVEIHYFDFDANLYNQEIQVSILKYLRPEHKFASILDLKEQLKRDQKEALQFVNSDK